MCLPKDDRHRHPIPVCEATHRSRARIGDPVLVWGPVMFPSLSGGKRTIKRCSDVVHVIDTHSVAPEHHTGKK